MISLSPVTCTGVPEKMLRSRRKNPIYITLFTWFVIGYVIALAYKSNLLANLVKVEVEKQPQTFQVSKCKNILHYISIRDKYEYDTVLIVGTFGV